MGPALSPPPLFLVLSCSAGGVDISVTYPTGVDNLISFPSAGKVQRGPARGRVGGGYTALGCARPRSRPFRRRRYLYRDTPEGRELPIRWNWCGCGISGISGRKVETSRVSVEIAGGIVSIPTQPDSSGLARDAKCATSL